MELESFKALAALGCLGGIALTVASGVIWYQLSNPVYVSNFNFQGGKGGTYLLPTFSEPRELGEGAVIFPREWTYLQRARWREEHSIHGAEWR